MSEVSDAVLFAIGVTTAAIILLALGFGALALFIACPDMAVVAGVTAGIVLWQWFKRRYP